jgi:hypothetical protein
MMMRMHHDDILKNLRELGRRVNVDGSVELLLVGGAAGLLLGELPAGRVTQDCDVIRCEPAEACNALRAAAAEVAALRGLPERWLSFDVMQLDVLPDGWKARRKHIDDFGCVGVYALSRQDLLATKFYAGHPRDVEDIAAMEPDAKELAFVRQYLNMLRVPSRQANLDQVASALKLVAAFEEHANG